MDIQFCEATPDDLSILRDMAIAFHTEDGHPLTAAGVAAVAHLAKGEPFARAWIVRCNDDPVGYVVITMGFDIEYGGRDGFISDLYLKPGLRGRGLGKALLKFAILSAAKLGIRTLHLEVEKQNSKALELYRAYGFEETGRSLLRLALADIVKDHERPHALQEMPKSAAGVTLMSGGCQCGAVRYRFSGAPGAATVCHCRMCQKASGNVMLPLISLSAADLIWTRGMPSEFRSSSVVARGFCENCGTPLYMREDGDPNYEIAIGSLDHPTVAPPTTQTGIESKLAWFGSLDHLPARRTDQDRTPADLARLISNQHPDRETDS